MAKFLDCIDLVSSFITANCLEGIASLCTTTGPELSFTQDEMKALSQVKDTESIDILIGAIHLMLEKETPQKKNQDNTNISSESTSMTEKLDEWTPLFETGATILTFVNDYLQKIGEKVDLFQSDAEVFKVVSEILKQVGQIHPVVAWLSMIGHLLTKKSENKDKCLELLKDMVKLAKQIKDLRSLVQDEKEKLNDALVVLVQGSMLCASQLYSKSLFSFLKISLDEQSLKDLRVKIDRLYPGLVVEAVIAMGKRQRGRIDIMQPEYPSEAVGIEEQVEEVKDWLQKETTDEPLRVAIIHGFGGIGKTILATAVYSKLNLDRYNHTRVVMDTDPHRNDIKKMQEQILEDAFPKYNYGKRIDFRNTKEGKEHLERAFREEKNPVFLFIDNALRNKDLGELLPENLEGLGKHIRLLLTTRDLAATNLFNRSLCHEHRVKPLPDSDAKKILCKETKNLDRIKDDVDRILKICGGVPLVLKIVGAHLKNQGYKADKCREILNAMERGEAITEDLKDLSECMVDFVFKKFSPLTQEAFLDTCCFFYGMNRRHVEYSVGSLALKTLEDAALITFKVVGNTENVVVDDVILAKGQNMGRSTRIKDIESFKDAVEEKRLGKIKGIQFCFGKGYSSYVIEKSHLNSMRKSLRVFMLGPNISVKSTSDMKFPELRFLHLDEDIPCLPFHLEDLDKLAVYHGPLLKEGVSIYKLPKSLLSVTATAIAGAIDNLEWTNGEQSKPLQVPPNSPLEELNLVRLWKMKTLPEGFQNFTALKILSLDTWDNMEELPVVICGLPRLSTLTLGHWDKLKYLPPSFGKLITLEYLALNGCSKLKELPSTIVELKNLRCLNLEACSSLMKLPYTFGKLTALESLNLKACSSLKELPGFEQLTELKYLNVQFCTKLRRDFRNVPSDLRIVIDEEEIESEEEEDWN